MPAPIVGRKAEQEILHDAHKSKRPEFIAIYGRRRVGKTFLVRRLFSGLRDTVFFNSTGLKDGSIEEQILNFTEAIGTAFFTGVVPRPGRNWRETFAILTQAMESVPKNRKIVLFLDELPWMATRNSRLLQTLDYYWNHHWSNGSRIKLIACGSSAAWIINKIINNKGGLHNRITRKIQLEPFNLVETAAFLKAQGLRFTHAQILQLYMAMGGIPYYLAGVPKGRSTAQAIENMAFRHNGLLLNEFDNLFASLFTDATPYVELLRRIARTRYGVAIKDIVTQSKRFSKGGRIAEKLDELEKAGFIRQFKPYKRAKKGLYYRLIDEYTLFYLRWIELARQTLQGRSLEEGYWQEIQQSPAWHAWAGYAFEDVCFKHLPAIRRKLKIPPSAHAYSWRHTAKKQSLDDGAQIDLLFDRRDGVVTVCEMKYSAKPFVIDKSCAKSLMEKIRIFSEKIKTRKQVVIAMVTANGLAETMYSEELIGGVVALEDLFATH